jgi:hypothetical protein
MAQTLHSLAIEIQGKIDSSFGGSVKDVMGHVDRMREGIKNISDGNAKIGGITRAFVNLSAEAAKTSRDMAGLNSRMGIVDGYNKQRAAAAEAAKNFRAAQSEVRRLERAQRDSGTNDFADELRGARREAANAERAYRRQRGTLNGLEERLRSSGIDTRNLSDEQRRLTKEFDAARGKSEELGRSMGRLALAGESIKKLKARFKRLGSDIAWVGRTYMKMGATLAAGGAGLFGVANSVANAGDEVDETAQKLRMGAEAFQELRYAAELSGVKSFDAMMTKLNANVAKFAKDSGGAKRLAEYGVNAKQLAKLKPDVAVMYLADKLNTIKDPAKRARAELDLFGKSGAEMGAFLSQGSKGIRSLRDQFKEAGGVISEETIAQAAAYDEARGKMMASITGVKNIVGAKLIPHFTELFGETTRFLIDNQPVIKEFAGKLGEGFKESLPHIKAFAKGAVKVISFLWDMGQKAVDLAGGAENLGMIVAALPLLKPLKTMALMGKTLFDLKKSFDLGSEGMGVFRKAFSLIAAHPAILVIAGIAAAAYLIYKNWDWLKAKFLGIWEAIGEKVKNIRNSIVGVFAGLPEPLQKAISFAAGVITAPFKVWREVVKGIIGFFKGDFESLPDALRSTLSNVWNIITKPFSDAFGWVREKWDSLKSSFGFGPTITVPVREGSLGESMQKTGVAGRARGGLFATPTIARFAERGPEVAVPVGMADRGLGMANLDLAARALGLGNIRGGQPANIEFSPVVHVSVNGGDPAEIKRVVIEALRECGAKMLPEWAAQIARTSYATG